jgi:hypothetical protein
VLTRAVLPGSFFVLLSPSCGPDAGHTSTTPEGRNDMRHQSKAAVLVGHMHCGPIVLLIGGRLGVQRPASRPIRRAPATVPSDVTL